MENIKIFTKKTKETKKELTTLKEERDILNNDNQHLIKEKAKLDLTIKDLSEEVQGDNNSKERAENELARLTQSIKEKEAELEKVSCNKVKITMFSNTWNNIYLFEF